MFDFEMPSEAKGEILDEYLAKGWFRIGSILHTLDYTTLNDGKQHPVCWLRYDVNKVKLRSSVTRIISANAIFTTNCHSLELNREVEQLFTKYKKAKHFITNPTLSSILVDECNKTFESKIMEVRHSGKLVAAGIFDVGRTSIQHIVSIYDPAYYKYSLGKFLIISIYKYCSENGFQYYYPGYYIPSQQVLRYKLFFDKAATEGYSMVENKWLPTTEFDIPIQVIVKTNWRKKFANFLFSLSIKFKKSRKRLL